MQEKNEEDNAIKQRSSVYISTFIRRGKSLAAMTEVCHHFCHVGSPGSLGSRWVLIHSLVFSFTISLYPASVWYIRIIPFCDALRLTHKPTTQLWRLIFHIILSQVRIGTPRTHVMTEEVLHSVSCISDVSPFEILQSILWDATPFQGCSRRDWRGRQ